MNSRAADPDERTAIVVAEAAETAVETGYRGCGAGWAARYRPQVADCLFHRTNLFGSDSGRDRSRAPLPFYSDFGFTIAVMMERKDGSDPMFGLISMPQGLPRFVRLPGHKFRYITMEAVISMFLDKLFPGSRFLLTACSNHPRQRHRDRGRSGRFGPLRSGNPQTPARIGHPAHTRFKPARGDARIPDCAAPRRSAGRFSRLGTCLADGYQPADHGRSAGFTFRRFRARFRKSPRLSGRLLRRDPSKGHSGSPPI